MSALTLEDDSFATQTILSSNVLLFGRSTNVVHVGSNGHITYDMGDSDFTESTSDHFALPRVAGLFRDLNPEEGGTTYWQQLSNRVGATFQLNARNIQEDGRLQPVAAFPDGTPSAYRIVDPRQFIFTVTFDL